MDRRILLFKTKCDEDLNSQRVEEIENKFIKCIQTYSLGPHRQLSLARNEIHTCFVPGEWTRVKSTADVKNKIRENKTYEIKDSTELSESINTMLDCISTPGRSLLNILWVCDQLPKTPCPGLYGALDRAVSWHSAQVTVITLGDIDDYPYWLNTLKAQVIPVSELCWKHGLEDLISPTLVWRGNLSIFNDTNYTSDLIEGFELHFNRDAQDLVLQKIKLSKSDYVKEEEQEPSLLFYGRSLELVCTVNPLEVPPNLITDQRYVIKSTYSENDEISKYILDEGSSAYIARLRVSEELDKKRMEKSSENWRKCLIEGKLDSPEDEAYLGNDPDLLHFLLYSSSAPPAVGDCSKKMQMSVILMKNPEEYEDHVLFRSFFNAGFEFQEDILRDVENIDVEYSIPPEVLHAYKRDAVAQVLESLLENKSDEIQKKSIEDLVLGVENKLEETWNEILKSRQVSRSKVDITNAMKEATKRLVSSASDNSNEKRALKMVEFYKKRQEMIEERDPNLVSRQEDTISLEPKEIVKFFEPNGDPAKSLTLETVSAGSKCLTNVSEEEYRRILQDNFEKLEDEEEFGGFKFKGKDFNVLEFTKFYDVNYNNGSKAEEADKEYVRMRDVYVGISKETSTSLEVHKAPEKLKLNQKNAALNRVRRSPRKKIGKSADRRHLPIHHQRKPLKPSNQNVLSSKISNRRIPPPKGFTDKRNPVTSSKSKTSKDSGQSAEDVRKKKLRVAVYQSLLEKGIEEKHPIFRRCFSTLFKMCQIIPIKSSGENTSKLLLDVARSNVENVLKAEAINMKQK